MTAPKFSLAQQCEAVDTAILRQVHLINGGSLRAMRAKREEQFDLDRLRATRRTLNWLEDNQTEIKAFLAVDQSVRTVWLSQVSGKKEPA